MEKVIPQLLNYADLKPEAIENQVKLVKFVPQNQSGTLRPNDVVKFMLLSPGFFDPYSSYIKFSVEVDASDLAIDNSNGNTIQAALAKFVDRSAHSFINRLVIRSQGTEIERIELYDVISAMINDVVYSPEQKVAHCYEGFPTLLVPHQHAKAMDTYSSVNPT